MELTPRRRDWLRRTEMELMNAGNWYATLSGQTECLYMGNPITNDWPADAEVEADFRRWQLQDEGRLDTADPQTFEGWVRCADGRTLWEYAKDGGKPR